MSQKTKIPLLRPHLGESELQLVQDVFQQNWIAPVGEHIIRFEKSLEDYLGNQSKVTVVNSGTAALHLALILLGVEAGDEVLCQNLTFAASVNPILYQGATPVFIESEPDTWNICPNYLEMAIKDRIKKGKKPRALMVVNLYGMPYKYQEIKNVTESYGIPIVEDSAEALGSTYHDKPCGTLGDISVFSFNGNKIVTTSGGGAVITKSQKLKEKALYLATQAKEKTVYYEHKAIGYNYRLSNILAAIGVGQMEVLQDRVLAKRRLHEAYKEVFKSLPGFVLFSEYSDYIQSNFWLNCVQIHPENDTYNRNDIMNHFGASNIEVRPLWKPMHLQPIFKNYPYYGSGFSEALFENGFCLPSATNFTTVELSRILTLIESLT